MNKQGPVERGRAVLTKRSKAQLITLILEQRKAHDVELAEKDKEIGALTEQLAHLSRDRDEQTEKEINKKVNEPSSKKPEWDKDGNPKPNAKKGNKKRKRYKRLGCGNVSKSGLEPDETHQIPLNECPFCEWDLSRKEGTTKAGRLVEDIDPPQKKPTLSKEIEESKWCPGCKRMVSSKTEKALPGSDIGLNAMIEMAYLWVMSALPLPKIQALFQSFKALQLSTAGISKIMIRLSEILQPVYDEILVDVKQGMKIWADETGWRVKGKLWWLWIFANERSAYYWVDQTRGSLVVERLLGEIFFGILIVDGWHAYNKLLCAKQSCMAHIFRKVRAFIDAYPHYRSIMTFYLKLRKIIRDGEKLQKARSELGEWIFRRRLKVLRKRLDDLLKWKNPNIILQDVIKKVHRQKTRILTFVEHEGAPHHNNYGEYIIKKGVLKRKVSGGSKSAEGARAYARLQSIAMTCQLRNISFHRFVKASLIRYIYTGEPMLLEEYESNMIKEKMAA
ncbi:MAG: IS66 family transposase [Nitrospirota bacterium]|nr:IS66 family transposase [Nitrospirota bacterium]